MRCTWVLIKFITTLSPILKKTCASHMSRDTCHFYRLGWKKFLQLSLKKNFVLHRIKTSVFTFHVFNSFKNRMPKLNLRCPPVIIPTQPQCSPAAAINPSFIQLGRVRAWRKRSCEVVFKSWFFASETKLKEVIETNQVHLYESEGTQIFSDESTLSPIFSDEPNPF